MGLMYPNLQLFFPDGSQVAAAAPTMVSMFKARANRWGEMVPISSIPSHPVESVPGNGHPVSPYLTALGWVGRVVIQLQMGPAVSVHRSSEGRERGKGAQRGSGGGTSRNRTEEREGRRGTGLSRSLQAMLGSMGKGWRRASSMKSSTHLALLSGRKPCPLSSGPVRVTLPSVPSTAASWESTRNDAQLGQTHFWESLPAHKRWGYRGYLKARIGKSVINLGFWDLWQCGPFNIP